MAKVIKRVDRGVAETQRSQVFTQADAGAGAIILVQYSLYKPAQVIHVESDGGMTVKFNVLRMVYPAWPEAGGAIQNPRMDLANGQEVEDESMAVVTIGAGETFSLDHDLAVSDIKIVTVTGDFEIFVA